MNDEVVHLKIVSQADRQRAEDELCAKLEDILYQFDGHMTVAAALGALRIVEHNFIKHQGL